MDSSFTPSVNSTRRHVRSLDGIRGLCCLAVVGHHFGLPGCQIGWIGVEMFFVLSGFLITTLLYREFQTFGRIELSSFWARRAFRLLPAYWIYASFLTIALFLTRSQFSPIGRWTLGVFTGSIWAYFVNFAPWNLWSHQLWTAHLWSLAKEEQFYLCWPVVLSAIGVRINRAWIVPVALAALGSTAFLGGRWGTVTGYVPMGISVGCTIAMLFAAHPEASAIRLLRSNSVRWFYAALCVSMLIVLAWRTHLRGDDLVRPWAMQILVPAYVSMFGLLVAALWYGKTDLLDRMLSNKSIAYVGTISYGIYLYHMVLIKPLKSAAVVVEHQTGLHVRFAIISVVFFSIVIGLAAASYEWVEKPMLRLGKKFRPENRDAISAPEPRMTFATPAVADRAVPIESAIYVGAAS